MHNWWHYGERELTETDCRSDVMSFTLLITFFLVLCSGWFHVGVAVGKCSW